LTGIDNLGTCRALLENKNWDLESAAREHLNLPSVRVHPEFQQRVPEPPVEAPEARQVLRPPAIHPRNNRNAVVPIGHTLFSWGVYLLTLPLRMTYRTVSSVFSVVLSILGFSDDDFNSLDRRRRAQILSSNTRPEQDVGEFLQEFNSQYTQDHVPFHSGSYSNALEEAKKDLKFLLVYLHCPSHQDTSQFCQQTLASPIMKDFAARLNVIVWACSVDTPEGYRVSQALRETAYPFLALIVLRQGKMMVVGRVEGHMEAEPLCQRLEIVVRDNEAYIVAARSERAERHINAEIRQEQDAAFQETLRLDQEREKLKQEAIEAKNREEAEERARVQDEADRKDAIRRMKIELVTEIPDEPDVSEPEAVRILIKLPEGQRLERRFLKHQSLKYLYYYVFCHPDSPDEFDITTNFPRKVLPCKPLENAAGGEDDDQPMSFEAAGLGKSTMLFVNDLDA
jgi:FAS-associated factor 2